MTNDNRAEWAERFRGADLLVIDGLSKCLAELGIDENDAYEVGRFFDGLAQLQKEAGIKGVVVAW